jgi:arabinofuranosyltransferase
MFACVHALVVFQTIIPDDAYILYRYARNLARGAGIVWNVGEPPIEGFTSLLHVLLLGLGALGGLDFTWTGQLLGIVATTCLPLAVAFLALQLQPRDFRLAAISAWGVALASPIAAWARGGLETLVFTNLVVLSTGCWLAARGMHRFPWRVPLLFFLSVLSRPEGMLIAGMAFCADLLMHRSGRGSLAGAARRWWLLALLLSGYLAFKLLYFGDPLPNTFYAKAGGGMWALPSGLSYVFRFVRDFGVPNLLLAAVPLFLQRARRSVGTGFIACFAALFAAQVAVVGGDYLYFHRYLIPIIPFLVILAIQGGLGLWDAAASLGRPCRALAGVGLLAVGMYQVFDSSLAELRDRPWLLTRPVHLVDKPVAHPGDPVRVRTSDFEDMGRALKAITGPGDLIAAVPVGALGYHSDRRILDMLGLNDREIARAPIIRTDRPWIAGHMRGNAELVLERSPEVLILSLRPDDEPLTPLPEVQWNYPFVAQILAADRFKTDYVLRSYGLPGGRWMNYYRRRYDGERSRASALPSEPLHDHLALRSGSGDGLGLNATSGKRH